MSGRRQGVWLLLLSLALPAFLVAHSLIVQVDFEACFGNEAASINGDRPYLGVAEMSLGRLARSAGRALSEDQLIIAALGLLPLAPFAIAWAGSRDRLSRHLWTACATVAFIAIVGWTWRTGLDGFYDCDRNGVSMGILFMPILYAAATLAATLALALLRSTVLSALGRE